MLDLCNPNPCHQGLPCQSTEGRYMCACPEGYYGNECTSFKNPCLGPHCPGERNVSVPKKVSNLNKSGLMFLFLPVCRCHVGHDTRWCQLLYDPGWSLSFSDGLRLCSMCLHSLPPSPQTEKAAGCPAGRRHQQPEGVCQPHQKRGPSCPFIAPHRPTCTLCSHHLPLTLL